MLPALHFYDTGKKSRVSLRNSQQSRQQTTHNNMGDQEENMKALYSRLALYVQEKAGIQYKAQAARLGLSPSQFQHKRTDERYATTERDIEEYRAEFWKELEGFDEPSPLQAELLKYKAMYEKALARLDDKDKVIEGQAEALAEIRDLIRRLKEEQK